MTSLRPSLPTFLKSDHTSASTSAFTLVELLIIVGILGLLAAVAIPSAMRARMRAQAVVIFNDARQLDAAKSQYGLEYGKDGSVSPAFADLTPYLKTDSKLASSGGNDILGNAYVLRDLSTSLQVSPVTQAALSTATTGGLFWGPYS